jgi:hypothetical protein
MKTFHTLTEIYEIAKELFERGEIDRDKLREFYELVYQNQLNVVREAHKAKRDALK